MGHIIVKFESEDEKAMDGLTKKLCDAFGSDSFEGVEVTAISRDDLFQQIEDIEDADSMKEVRVILARSYD